MAAQERIFDKYPAQNPFDPFHRIIAGGSLEVATFRTYTLNNVGGKIIGQREVSGEMVGGRLEGGRTVEFKGELTDEAFVQVREIIANSLPRRVPVETVTEEVRLIEDLDADSMAAADMGLQFQNDILGGNIFPSQFASLITKPSHVREILDILLLEKSPMPDVPLEQVKLQLINALMYYWLAVAKERNPIFDDSSITEITNIGRA